MKYTRLPVKGIDRAIQDLQTDLHDTLLCNWQLPEDQYQCFGRVYSNPVAEGYLPQAYISEGNYRDVLLDDRYAAQSFFVQGVTVKQDGPYNVADLSVIFFVHLGKIATELAVGDVRADNEAREAVQAILGANMHGFTLTKIETGVREVMRGFVIAAASNSQTTNQQKRGLKEADIHPFHLFRVNGTLRYPKPNTN